jgi:hypothetical protein
MRTADDTDGSGGAQGARASPPRPGVLRRVAVRASRSRVAHGLARLGFVVKAALYGVVGTLALRIVLGRGGATVDVKGALGALGDGPLGVVTVSMAALGLAGLGAWFVLEAITNPAGDRGAWSVVSRVGQALGGVGYVLLACVGVRLAFGESAGPSGDELARRGVAQAFAHDAGPAALLVGLVAVGVGVRQAHLGWTCGFVRSIDLGPTSPLFRRWAPRVGLVGFTAQGTLFAMMGLFLVQAVVLRDPSEATGTAGALEVLASRHYGRTLLAAASVGLLSFALFAGIEGACKRFPGTEPVREAADARNAPRSPRIVDA